MFLRVLGTACVLSLTFASLAQADERHAADPQAIVYDDGTPAAQHRIAVAAKALCKKAVDDNQGEYGSFEECVANARLNVHPVGDGAQAVADAK